MYQSINPALGDRREVREGDRHHVERHRHRLAMEVTSAEQLSGVGEYERVIGGGVQLAADDAGAEIDRVEHRAVHLGHAAERVLILDPWIALAMRLADLAVTKK